MINEYVVDGVPTLVAPGSGPLRAGLMFRVGEADETLAQHGITHLLEHLALHPYAVADYHANGMTGAIVTQFVVQGDAETITTYFRSVCTTLDSLPHARLDVEKDILRVEARQRGGLLNDIPMWRHGAQGYGLSSTREFGLFRITSDDVEAWRRRWFTRANAVLWIAGCDEPPAGLRLALPDGTRMPAPAETSALPTMPAYFNGPAGVAVADMSVDRVAAATIYTEVLERELYRRLRRDGGVSYTTQAVLQPRNGEQSTVRALVDGVTSTVRMPITGLVEAVGHLANGDIDDADITAAIRKFADAFSQPHADMALVPGAAFDLLVGHTPSAAAQKIVEVGDVNAEAVAAVAAQAASSALYMIPEPYHLMAHGIEAAPTRSRHMVSGASYRSKTHREIHLVIGPDGASVVGPFGSATVRYDQCVALLAYPDGARSLIGADAVQVTIEPTVFGIDTAGMRSIDLHVDSDIVISMPERQDSEIPVITARTQVRAVGRSLRRARFWWGVKRDAARHSSRHDIAMGLATLIAFILAGWAFTHRHPGIGVLAVVVGMPVAVVFFRNTFPEQETPLMRWLRRRG